MVRQHPRPAPLLESVLVALRKGHDTPEEIAEALDQVVPYVRVRLTILKKRGLAANPARGVWRAKG